MMVVCKQYGLFYIYISNYWYLLPPASCTFDHQRHHAGSPSQQVQSLRRKHHSIDITYLQKIRMSIQNTRCDKQCRVNQGMASSMRNLHVKSNIINFSVEINCMTAIIQTD